jgi:cation diffusion facilitator CzcD-associated flavoprotein CzcO
MPTAPAPLDVAIIGSGFSGLCMAIRLKQAGGFSFTVFEKAAEVGGTWRDNRYPGCACDIQSHVYSFSFEQNPRWTRMFAPQEEIWDYLKHCTDKYGIAPHIRFETPIARVRFDDDRRLWELTSEHGEIFFARYVVSATGGLHVPAIPDLPGRARFGGRSFHSAQWDHAYPLEGRRVAVIGTGASAIQLAPRIAPLVAELSIFQRTAPWIIPKPDREISAAERWLFERLPVTQRWLREALYWQLESRGLAFATRLRILEVGRRIALRHIARQIRDPDLARKVTPDYAMGCKRILISNDYYPTLNRPNVRVVTEQIREIVEEGIVTGDGALHPADAIVYGTGFKVHEPVRRGTISGRGGLDLADAWPTGPEAYLGVAVHGFPNFFFLLGPNSGLGHNSMVYMIESQVAYIMDALATIRAEKLTEIEVSLEAQDAYNEGLQKKLSRAVWSSGCRSWYLNEHGKNTVIWPGFTFRYRALTRKFDRSVYETRTQDEP